MGQAPAEVDPAHCLSCRQCVAVCPQGAVHFGREAAGTMSARKIARKTAGTRSEKTAEGALSCSSPSRRKLFCAAGAGAAVALLGRLPGQSGLFPATTSLVRPPAALPEEDFLRLCLRCGACMQVCPGKALQPLLFQAGRAGFHSPVLAPRLGACLPDCALCGTVCPTGALKKLPLQEKRWAKMGTAVVNRTLCLAFAERRRCMVCKELPLWSRGRHCKGGRACGRARGAGQPLLRLRLLRKGLPQDACSHSGQCRRRPASEQRRLSDTSPIAWAGTGPGAAQKEAGRAPGVLEWGAARLSGIAGRCAAWNCSFAAGAGSFLPEAIGESRGLCGRKRRRSERV